MSLSAKKITIILLAVNTLLLAVFVLSQYLVFHAENTTTTINSVVSRLDMGKEISIPTWYNQILLFIAAAQLGVIGYIDKHKGISRAKYWFGLSAIFIYLSIDEGAMLHEISIEPVQSHLNIDGGYLYFAWVIPVLMILTLLVGLFIRFYMQLPRDIKIIFIIALLVFIGGAVGMEMLAGNHLSNNVATDGRWDHMSVIYTGIEEWLEMTGIVIFIYGLLRVMHKMDIHKIKLPAIKI